MKKILILSLLSLAGCHSNFGISLSHSAQIMHKPEPEPLIEQRLSIIEQQIQFLTEQAKQDRSMEANRFQEVAKEIGAPIPGK